MMEDLVFLYRFVNWLEESDKGGGTWHMFFSAQHIWILTYETWKSAVNSARCKHQKTWGMFPQ